MGGRATRLEPAGLVDRGDRLSGKPHPKPNQLPERGRAVLRLRGLIGRFHRNVECDLRWFVSTELHPCLGLRAGAFAIVSQPRADGPRARFWTCEEPGGHSPPPRA